MIVANVISQMRFRPHLDGRNGKGFKREREWNLVAVAHSAQRSWQSEIDAKSHDAVAVVISADGRSLDDARLRSAEPGRRLHHLLVVGRHGRDQFVPERVDFHFEEERNVGIVDGQGRRRRCRRRRRRFGPCRVHFRFRLIMEVH